MGLKVSQLCAIKQSHTVHTASEKNVETLQCLLSVPEYDVKDQATGGKNHSNARQCVEHSHNTLIAVYNIGNGATIIRD